MTVTPIAYLQLGVEQFLRELPDEEFEALTARVRPPNPRRYSALASEVDSSTRSQQETKQRWTM